MCVREWTSQVHFVAILLSEPRLGAAGGQAGSVHKPLLVSLGTPGHTLVRHSALTSDL